MGRHGGEGQQLHHLRFADDIVLITPSISQAERMLTEFDKTCGCIGLQDFFLLKDDVHAERMGLGCPIHVQRNEHVRTHQLGLSGRELKKMNDLTPELGRRRRTAWGAYKSNENVVKKT
ncbi:hypothetical protein RB195_002051 [Necator americanus]|uniref:Reverse transcriptase domain-containing protein n=1 Tax=Necator americanus TaxID=51031 RepID=A0ABR1DH58_NECAM